MKPKPLLNLVLTLTMLVGALSTPVMAGSNQLTPTLQATPGLEIRLQRATFDPLAETPHLAADLTLSAYPGDGSGAYLVQFQGPILTKWKEALRETGAIIHGYVPQFAYVVRMDDATAARVRALDTVRWVGPYQPAFRLSTALDTLIAEATRDQIARIVVRSFSGEPAEELAEQLKSLGATLYSVGNDSGGGVIVKLDLPVTSIPAVARLGAIAWVEPWAERRLTNEISRSSLAMNKDGVEAELSLYGAGQIVVSGDTGVSTGNEATMHPDLQGRLYRGTWGGGDCGSWEDYHSHGTHVAGSVLGNGIMDGSDPANHAYFGANAGIAPEALLWAWAFCSDWSGLPDAPYDDYYGIMYDDDPRTRVNTNSWGSVASSGTYDSFSRETDRFIWDHQDMVVVFSAANAGRDVDSDGVVDQDSMGVPAGAKNIITVGAAENYRMSGGYNPGGPCSTWGECWPSDFPANPVRDDRLSDDPSGMVAFSSRGPTDDGRLKPDILAPGSNIVSTRYHGTSVGWGVYNDYYIYMGGTSMAAPLAAGASAIVREFYTVTYGIDPMAALVKATLINGAYDMTPGQYRDEAPDGNKDDVIRRPDNHQGWGRVDLYNSLVHELPYQLWFYQDHTGLNTAEQYETTLAVNDDEHPFRVTLAWTDYPGEEATHGALVNDLDLEIVAPDGATYYGNDVIDDGLLDGDVDHTNNIEGIDFNPQLGTYTIVVRGYNVPQGPQPFALVASGDTRTLSYLDGTVYDGTLGGGLEGASVQAITGTVQYQVTTDASGYYTTPVAIDTYTINAWKYGYTLETLTDTTTLTNTVTTHNFTLTQTSPYSLTGCITDSMTSAPLAATVSVLGPFGDTITQTDAPQGSGCYTLTLYSSPYTLTAAARLHQPGVAFVELDTDTVQNFALQATTSDGLLWGQVTGLESARPLEGATIQVTPGLTSTQSGADGSYEMQLPNGVYTVTVSLSLYSTLVETDVVVPQGNLVKRNYALPSPNMTLRPSMGLDAILRQGQRTTHTLILSNTGSSELEFTLLERLPDFNPLPQQRDGGGPDPYGYTYLDSTERDGPLFEWVDATDGTALGLSDDGETNVTLPFNFNFYGTDSTDLRVGNNGGLLFGVTSGHVLIINEPLTSARMDNLIAPFSDDIDDETGDVYYKVIGSPGRRRFVVEWHDRPHYNNIGDVTFELILYEGTNNIKFQYQDVVFGDPTLDYGASATVGIRERDTNYLQYSYNHPTLSDGMSICFQHPGSPPCDLLDIPWLHTSVVSGTVAAGDALTVQVGFDASVPDVDQPGDYSAVLRILTNDPEAQPSVEYPVMMTVLPPLPELHITKTSATDRAEIGTVLSYTLTITNTGGPATGAVISDTLPANTLFARADDGGALVDGDVIWHTTVPASSTLAVSYSVTVTCVASGTQIVNAAPQVTATEWMTPTLGQAVTVTAIAEGVVADLSFPTPAVQDYPVSFTNLSQNATHYGWAFGDGTFSTQAHPAHPYSAIGPHTVVLTATNICDSDVVSYPLTVENYAAAVAPPSDSASADPGKTVAYTLRMTNTGTLSDAFQVTAIGYTWLTQLSTDTLRLDANQGTTTTILVTVPAAAPGGAQDNVLINVHALSDPRVPPLSGNAILVTTANNVHGITPGPTTPAPSGMPGETVTHTWRITNAGNFTDSFDLVASGHTWTTTLPFSVGTLSIAGPLAAGASTDLKISVKVPPDVISGQQDTVTITAASQSDPSQWASAVLTTTAFVPTFGVKVEPPNDARSGAVGTSIAYTLHATNTADVPDSFAITVSGNNWTTTVPGSIGPLAVNESADVPVTVQIPGSANHGDDDTATITVTSLGDPTVSDDSVLTSTAIVASYSVRITPPAVTRSGEPGATVAYTLTVQNLGTDQDTFAASLGAHAWNTVASKDTIGPLAANATDTLKVSVSIPAMPFQHPYRMVTESLSDTVIVTLTSLGDVHVSDASTLTTRVIRPSVYLPLILVNFSPD